MRTKLECLNNTIFISSFTQWSSLPIIYLTHTITCCREDKASDVAEFLAGLPSLLERGQGVDRDAKASDDRLGEDHVHQQVVERGPDL